MAKFIIHSHGRLQEWVAEEKGYFSDEGLNYDFVVRTPALWSNTGVASDQAPTEVRRGAYESYQDGRDCNVSCACHWTVNMAASAGHGRLWGGCYSVAPSGLFVAPESDIRSPEDLADVEVCVGYHSGSHYSTVQGLETFLPRDRIKLRFAGVLHDRLALLVDRKVAAANAFGAPYYMLEQLGFRNVLDTTFMIAALINGTPDIEDVRKYFRALKRAQTDIDLRFERYTHYYLKELPERYHAMIDVRRFGPGERIVFQPYSKDLFEATHGWVQARDFFPADEIGQAPYEEAVLTA